MFDDDDDVPAMKARFEAAALALAKRVDPGRMRELAERIERTGTFSWMVEAVPPEHEEAARAVLDIVFDLEDFSTQTAGAYLRGIAAGFEHHQACCR
ncbi:hypothetical protein [Sphaerimonospora thailandensis]|uniref:Uncharacterized protein n=1 Tax=Sphaerimonospora thailandensis TaxID=795644 RepID=A0A8J3R7F7_9ACTN|nr:hypothetical protein [Sphaerimonospora thailandensis]GIH69760.1 hypothetical protein Mth01_20130 [Sphaerimonospora thailandensis]